MRRTFSILWVAVVVAGAGAVTAACAKLPPDATERADGTVLYCSNTFNARHVLAAAQEYCAPEPAQFVGPAACGTDTLREGRVYRCGYDPGYAPLRGEKNKVEAGDSTPNDG